METWQAAVLTALSLGLVSLITIVFTGLREVVTTWFRSVTNNMRRKSYLTHISRVAKFLALVESVRDIEEVQRVVLFRGHNCGGVPVPGKPYTVRAIDGWTSDKEKQDPLQKFDFALSVDADYVAMLKEMLAQGVVSKVTEKMPNDSRLKAYYESEGVLFSQMYYLGVVDSELIYISVGSYRTTNFSRKTEIDVQLVVDRIRSVLDEGETAGI
jgi:hypothetical protein